MLTPYSSELTQTKKSLCRAHSQRTTESGYLRSLRLRCGVMEGKKRTTRRGSMKGKGIPTGKRKKLKTHSIASKINLGPHCSSVNNFMVSDYHFPGSPDGGTTSVVASKTSVSLCPHLIRVNISLLFLCLALAVRNKWPSNTQLLLRMYKSPCASFFLWLWPGKRDSVICSLPSDRNSSLLTQH